MAVRATTLGRVIRTAATQDRASTTDRELLRQFDEDGDQESFEVLVRRHTGLVLEVCRRALTNAQDAEDACQATFLILARKAGAGRWQPSIANWLFATARKVAANLRRDTDRRAQRECRAAVPEAVEPIDQMTGRELLAAVDQELDRLPAVYREVLLLLFQQELAREEIAVRLGVPVGTVKVRLERGRKKLADALARRGVTLGAALLALVATSRTGASPPRLVEAIRAAVAGKASPSVAALAEGVAVNGFAKQSVLGAVVLVLAGAVGFGVGAPRVPPAGPQPEKGPPAKTAPPDKAKAEAGERTITGRVIGPDGKPVAGAELLLQRRDGTAKKLGVSGADGRFTVTAPRGEERANLTAKVDGAGVEFLSLGGIGSSGEVELRLVKDRPIKGRVVNTEGKPVAGLTVLVKHVGVYANNNLDAFLAGWKVREPIEALTFGVTRGTKHLNLADTALLPGTTTDAGGRFTVTGVGDERLVELRLRGTGIADHDVWVVNRAGFDPKPYNQAMRDKLPKYPGLELDVLLSGPEPAVVVEPDKPIRGVVRDKDTGKPRVGVMVVEARDGLEEAVWRPRLYGTTDAEGRYEIRGGRKSRGYWVKVSADLTTGHVAAQVKGDDTPGYEPVTINIEVKKGVIVTGRVIDKPTGKALPGWASVSVLEDNKFVKDYPEFGQDWFASGGTRPDGTFRCVTIPGQVTLTGGPGDGVDGVRYKDYPGKVLDIKPGTATVTQDIELELATALPVKVRDAEGQPLSGAWVTGISSDPTYPTTVLEGDSCAAYDLDGKPRLMVFYEPKKKLFGKLTLKGDEKEPMTVTLGPGGAVKGRLVGEDGKPLAGVTVSLHHPDRERAEVLRDHIHLLRPITTDANGEFQITDVIPGVKCVLLFSRGQTKFAPGTRGAAVRTAEPGKTTDMGELKLKVRDEGGE
jgi:RNA polymerase sigma factor (sigma-70 family)